MVSLHLAFLPLPAFGHIHVTLPVVTELLRRGHRVTFATTERFAPVVAGTGADVLRYESLLADREMPERVDAEYLVHEPVRSIDEAIATVPQYEAALAGDVPDLLLYDVSTFAAGRVLARKWRRPAIELFPTFASNDHYSVAREIGARYADQIDPHHPALVDFFVKQEKLLREHGLDGVSLEEFTAPAEEANLVFVSRRLQPAADTFDDRFEFVGSCVGSRQEDTSGWREPPPEEPVALVSLGSFSYGYQERFVHTCLEAFAGTPWQVVMSVGRRVDVDALRRRGEVPSNVQLLRWVPQLAVLRRADVFVSHAGMNSVMEAMRFATPVVAVPHMPEQCLVAERLVELGLGVRLPAADEVTAGLLRKTVDDLAADQEVRSRVRALGAELSATDGPARAADYIEGRCESNTL